MTFFVDPEDLKHYASVSKPAECQEICLELSAEEGTKLFPTVVTTPSQETLFTMNLAPAEDCRPLSSTFIKSLPSKTVKFKTKKQSSEINYCPRRLDLMIHTKSEWARQEPKSPKYSVMAMGKDDLGALAFTTGREVVQNVSITLPQEDVVMDIKEMAEYLNLQEFYIETLNTFCSISSHSNLEMAKSIICFFDSDQLLQCLKVSAF